MSVGRDSGFGGSDCTIVIPNWNGARWLDPLFASIRSQSLQPDEVIVVDNGSTDGSAELIRQRWPQATLIELGTNRGFAAAVNAGIAASRTSSVALVNTDIELDRDWLARSTSALTAHPRAASVATKMVDLDDPGRLYDTGNWLRRDGAAEQRGRFRSDDGRFDAPGEVWSACAGAAVYRRQAVLDVGGFDERLFTYLEDVELGLRLRLAGWTCRYEPCVARHAGGGSEAALPGGAVRWVERNTILVVARHFPLRWLPLVLYRQIAWAVRRAREGTLRSWASGLLAGLWGSPGMVLERRRSGRPIRTIAEAVPARPWRGPSAGGHPKSPE